MYALHRWWERYGVRAVLVGAAIAAAWGMRQGQAGFIYETYSWLSRPFQGSPEDARLLENARIDELQQQVQALEAENRSLKELVGHQEGLSVAGTVAPVIGRSADRWWSHLVIGRGSRDPNITDGSVVVAPGGLVGRVVSTTPNASLVLLVSDPSSQIGVSIGRSRFMGYMRGTGDDTAVMEFFDKLPDVQPGDAVVTSTFSQLFPPGLPVGRVESVDMKKGPAPEATLKLSAPLSVLEWVAIYPPDVEFQDALQELMPDAPSDAPTPEDAPLLPGSPQNDLAPTEAPDAVPAEPDAGVSP